MRLVISFFTFVLTLSLGMSAVAGPPAAKGGRASAMHSSVEGQATFTKMDEVKTFAVEGVHIGMSHAEVKAILKANGWTQLDLDEQNHGLIFYKGERRSDNVAPNSLHPKPGTTIYKFTYRIAGNTTSLHYARQYAPKTRQPHQSKHYEGPIPADAQEVQYVKDLRDLVCAGYTDKIMINRYCEQPDTDDHAGFKTPKTVPVYNSLEEGLSVRASSQKPGGELSIVYVKK